MATINYFSLYLPIVVRLRGMARNKKLPKSRRTQKSKMIACRSLITTQASSVPDQGGVCVWGGGSRLSQEHGEALQVL